MKYYLLIAILSCLTYSCLSDPIGGCDDVLSYYAKVGFPVTDCLEYPLGNSTFWRVDNKQPFSTARFQCKAAGDNADLAIVSSFQDQRILNDLFTAKTVLNTWVWIGIYRNQTSGKLLWLDNTPVQITRWYPYPDSTENGDCAVMIMLSDPNGDKDVSGTFYYTEPCENSYIAICQARDVPYDNV